MPKVVHVDATSLPVAAQAHLLHQTFLGLQPMVAVEQDKRRVVYEWMFRLFRRRHEEKFLLKLR